MGALKRYEAQGLITDQRTEDQTFSLLGTVAALPVYIGAPAFSNEKDEDDIPIIQLSKFVMRTFPHFTNEMVTKAFDYAAAGRLYEDGKRVRITTYGKQMNIEVLGGVLRAYDELLNDAPKKETVIINPHLLPSVDLEVLKMKPVDHYRDLLEKIKETGTLPKYHVWKVIHLHLMNIGEVEQTKETRRRTGSMGSIRSILQTDIHKKAVSDYLIKKGLIK